MKKDARHILAVLALVLAAMLLAAGLGDLAYAGVYNKTFEAGYRQKLERLSSIEGKKAVFIGGSSCIFGVQSALFERETGIPSVNMAVSVGVPLRLYLQSAAAHLKAGDELFLALEYGYYSRSWDEMGESGCNFMVYNDPSLFGRQSPRQTLRMLPDLLIYGWSNWQNAVQELIRYYLLGGFGVYGRDSLNENGDMAATRGLPNEPGITTGFMNYAYTGTTDVLRAWIDEQAARGVKVYIVFEPLMEGRFTDGLDVLYAELLTFPNATVLGTPQDYSYPYDAYFNSDQHLNYDAAAAHTQRIIDLYRAAG